MISIIGDDVVEDTESFSVSLTSKDNAVTLAQSSTSVTIQGDDSKMYKFQQNCGLYFVNVFWWWRPRDDWHIV